MVYELDPCRVHGQDGELVTAGHVRSADGDTMVLEAERYSGRSLMPGDPVVLEVASAARGACTFDAVVVASGVHRLEVTDLRLREVVQQRTAVRVAVATPVRFAAQVVEGETAPLDPPLHAVLIDVSATGLRFRTDQPVPVGTVLVTEFPARRPVRLAVEVLRHEELRAGVAHGARFLGLSEREQDDMFAFVLDEQRRQLAERRDR